jgi:hypothetical protein
MREVLLTQQRAKPTEVGGGRGSKNSIKALKLGAM